MLFQYQRDVCKIVQGDVIYFGGAFIADVKTRKAGLVLGIKQSDGNVRTRVSYHQDSKEPVIAFEQTLGPIDFEKFLDSTATAIAGKMNSKLIEFNYRTRTLDDAFSAHVDEIEKDTLHNVFLTMVASGKSRTESYEQVTKIMMELVSQRI